MRRKERVADPHQWWSRFQALAPPKPKTRDPFGGEEIHEFWGQRWFIPNSKTTIRVHGEGAKHLVWIRWDLWLAKTFEPVDCFLVGDGDKWDEPSAKLSFTEDIWGKGKRLSFVKIVKGFMVGRGRGRGLRPRCPEEDWGAWDGGN